MQTYLERGCIRDDVYINLLYRVDDNNVVSCAVLNEIQLQAFSDYVHETNKNMPTHGNSLRESTPEEIELWSKFCETMLVCKLCSKTPVKFNPYRDEWLCVDHQTGIEE